MYGVDIYRVREIIRVPAITRVPRAPEYVEGVINLRGGVIPVIDLRKRFGMEKGEESAERRIVVSELGNQTVGMVVDGVSEVLEVDEAEIDPPSEYVMTVDSQYITGIVKREKLIILLDLEKVLEVSRRDDKAVAEVGE
ncbi:MAG: chemotaxis protein CheW [Clostridia bacterium]|nr:chemotaxis protein CheW [Bacillota bacterium]MBO2522076.1 chemotaxis protein CheW [Bacillota bacterium]